jgi:hypothetical protein
MREWYESLDFFVESNQSRAGQGRLQVAKKSAGQGRAGYEKKLQGRAGYRLSKF